MSAVLQFFPERLDVNGDAQNALVLARRAAWAGVDVELRVVSAGDRVPSERPAAIVIGSSVDAELVGLRADLADFAAALLDWVDDGVPLLAVGTGLELLSEVILLGESSVEGVGLFPGRATSIAARATGDLVVDTEFGRLVGFENHARGFLVPADAPAFGTVVAGVGDDDLRSEGSRRGSAIGTHLHGPVLAKNPALADAMLSAAFGERALVASEEAARADGYAASARAAILTRLELASSR